MISTFMAAGELHAVYVIHQKGLTKIKALGFCKTEENAGDGVYQVPIWAFDGRPKYGEISVCAHCARAVSAMKEPPR